MKRMACRTVMGIMLLFIAVSAAGCGHEDRKSAVQPPAVAAVSPSPPAAIRDFSVTAMPQEPAVSPQATPHTDKGTQTLSNDNKPENKPVDGKTTEAKPAAGGQLSLLGLTLDDTRSSVEERFGKPAQTYTMDSETEPVSVGDYRSFSIGFRADGGIIFIDISLSEVDPGLGGVKIGNEAEDAEKALGKPDVKSGYSLVYESKTTVLKFDLDPKTKSILSIKLFGRDEK